jgi:plastocyanin
MRAFGTGRGQRAAALAGVLAAVVGLAACDSGGGGGGGAKADKKTGATSFAFDPKAVTVAKSVFAIKLANSGSTAHTFTIDEAHVDQQVEPGKSSEVLVTMGSAKQFTFYCRFHRGVGMEGTLTLQG